MWFSTSLSLRKHFASLDHDSGKEVNACASHCATYMYVLLPASIFRNKRFIDVMWLQSFALHFATSVGTSFCLCGSLRIQSNQKMNALFCKQLFRLTWIVRASVAIFCSVSRGKQTFFPDTSASILGAFCWSCSQFSHCRSFFCFKSFSNEESTMHFLSLQCWMKEFQQWSQSPVDCFFLLWTLISVTRRRGGRGIGAWSDPF